MNKSIFFLLFCLLFFFSQQSFSERSYIFTETETENLKAQLKKALEEVNLLRLDLTFVSGNQKLSSEISESFKTKIKDLETLNEQAELRLNEHLSFYEKKIEKLTDSEKKTKKELETLKGDVIILNDHLEKVKILLRAKQRNKIIENIGFFVAGILAAIGFKALADFFGGNLL